MIQTLGENMKALVTAFVKMGRLTYVASSCSFGEGFGIWRAGAAPERKTFDFERGIQSV